MRYYFKIASKQDETRSFVINRSAAVHFFKLGTVNHGDNFDVLVKTAFDSFSTKIVVHQDVRILLPLGFVSNGDTVVCESLDFRVYKIRILSVTQSYRVSVYMEDNHFMTNTDLLCQ